MNKTPLEKLATVRVELVTLKPRLPNPYYRNLEKCVEYLDSIEEAFRSMEATLLNRQDASTTEIVITVEDETQARAILNALEVAEEEGELEFGFQTEVR